jgi:CBS domain containing-hemolysin-like protein
MTPLPWFVLALLIALNALYVAAEFAAVAAPRSQLTRLGRDGSRRAQGLLAVLENGKELDRYIAACQVGITITSLLAGAYAQATITVDLAPLFGRLFGLTEVAAGTTTAVIVLVVLTAVQVLLGELVPKSIALQLPVETALFTYLPTRWSLSFYRFFIWILNGSALLLLKPFGVTSGGSQHVHSPGEIELLLAESRRRGTVSPELYRRLERGLHLSTRTVRQLMVPRNKMVAAEVSTPKDELVRLLRESPYSRVPIYRGNLDEVLGSVNTKDVVALYAARGQLPPLEQLVRPMVFVPETLSADRLVRFLQDKRSSKALVVNEFGGVEGLVSIEDVLAEVLGELVDEIQPEEPGPEVLEGGRVRLPGGMALEDAEPFLGRPPRESASTVGGWMIERLGRLPREGDEVRVDGAAIVVTEMGPTAVQWVEVQPGSPDKGQEEPAS